MLNLLNMWRSMSKKDEKAPENPYVGENTDHADSRRIVGLNDTVPTSEVCVAILNKGEKNASTITN